MIDMEVVMARYKQAYEEFGDTAEGVHWNGQESQNLRFALINCLLPEGSHRIGDFGSGACALYKYLTLRGRVASYVGVELNLIAREEAKKTCLDVRESIGLLQVEWWVVSGTFNLMASNRSEYWYDYVQAQLRTLLRSASKGVIVNFMNADVCDHLDKELFYMSPGSLRKMLPECKMEFLQHSALYEFTAKLTLE